MAIPAIPQGFIVQQGNLQVYCSWDIQAGATSYSLQRSTDNVTFAALATVASNDYLDTTTVPSTQYFYRVASVNASGASPYTSSESIIPVNTGEMSLAGLRLAAQQRADMVNSQFITKSEWNVFINQAMFELYDMLVTAYEDYYLAPPVQLAVDGTTSSYPLPNGVNYNAARPFYKLVGVDLALNTSNNAWVTLGKFNFSDRNSFVYPNSTSTIYGVFNLRYRVMGSNLQLIPVPSGGQIIRMWYVPRMNQLLKDTDTTDVGISGWLQYVIIRAAKYGLDKEESDTSKLDTEIAFLKERIEATAQNRDAGTPDTISETRDDMGQSGGGYRGPIGGW